MHTLRHWITLIEAKTFMLHSRYGMSGRVWENATASQLVNLVRRYKELRGFTHEDDYWVWNAHDMQHGDARSGLSIPTDLPGDFVITVRSVKPEAGSSYADATRYDSDKMSLWLFGRLPPRLAQIFTS